MTDPPARTRDGGAWRVAFTTDRDGRISSWSREAADLTGYRADAIANQPLALVIGASDKDEAATRAPLAATDEIARVIRVRRQDGRSFEAAHCSFELTDATGIIGHVHVLESLPAASHDERA